MSEQNKLRSKRLRRAKRDECKRAAAFLTPYCGVAHPRKALRNLAYLRQHGLIGA